MNPDEVTGIDQGTELSKAVSQRCFFEKQLDRSRFVSQCEKSKLAHHTARHHPASNRNFLVSLAAIREINVVGLQASHAIAEIETQRIRLLPLFFESIRLLQAGLTKFRQERRSSRAPSCPAAGTKGGLRQIDQTAAGAPAGSPMRCDA